MNKNIFINSIMLAGCTSALANVASQETVPIGTALTGKLAYLEGNYQVAHDPLRRIVEFQPHPATYLQYMRSALEVKSLEALLSITQQLASRSNEPLYKKGEIFLTTYIQKIPEPELLDNLSKEDWFLFFSLLPAKERMKFIEQIYQPEMVLSSSTRAFLAELFMLIQLKKEAGTLLTYPTNNLNADLIDASQKILSLSQQRDFLVRYGETVPNRDQQFWLEAVALAYDNMSFDKKLSQTFLYKTASPEVFDALLAGGHTELAEKIINKTHVNEERHQLMRIEVMLARYDFDNVKTALASYHPKSSDYYKITSAKYYYKTGQYQEALASLTDIDTEDLMDDVLLLKVKILLKVDPKTALLLVTQLQQKQIYPEHKTMFMQALALTALGHPSQAVLVLERLRAQAPGYVKATIVLADLYWQQQKTPQEIQAVLGEHGNLEQIMSGHAAIVMAETHQALGNIEMAKKYAKKALDLQPNEINKERARVVLNN